MVTEILIGSRPRRDGELEMNVTRDLIVRTKKLTLIS